MHWSRPRPNFESEYLYLHLPHGIKQLMNSWNSMPAGWLIPVALIVVVSFPPVGYLIRIDLLRKTNDCGFE